MPHRSPGRHAGRVSPVAFATTALLTATLTTAGVARAQDMADSAVAPVAPAVEPAAAAPLAPATSAVPVGPTLDGARAGATRAATATDAEQTAVPVSGPRAGRPIALMVVGGAALILGAIIGGSGGTALAVGGAVVGLVGLYQFVR